MKAHRSFALALALAVAAACLLTQLGGPSVAFAIQRSPRGGALHVTKECSRYTGAAGSFCTITSSNVRAIKVGMRVVYEHAATIDFALDSDIVLSFKHGSAAHGHVILQPGGSTGTVTLDGGTGTFRTFHASALVTCSDDIHCAWDGRYTVAR
jgi:hypothetical protein